MLTLTFHNVIMKVYGGKPIPGFLVVKEFSSVLGPQAKMISDQQHTADNIMKITRKPS